MKGTTKGVLLKRMGRRKLCVRRNLFRRIEFRCLTGPKRKMCTSWVAMWHGRWSESSEVQAGQRFEATDRPCQPPCHWPGCPCLTPHLDSRLHRNHVIIPEDVLRRFLSLPLITAGGRTRNVTLEPCLAARHSRRCPPQPDAVLQCAAAGEGQGL